VAHGKLRRRVRRIDRPVRGLREPGESCENEKGGDYTYSSSCFQHELSFESVILEIGAARQKEFSHIDHNSNRF